MNPKTKPKLRETTKEKSPYYGKTGSPTVHITYAGAYIEHFG